MKERDNAERFLDAYASIERSLNRLLCKTDYIPFKKLVRLAAKNNAVVAKNEETLKEYADLRNAIVHQRSRIEEIIAEPTDSVTDNIERIAEILDADESVFAYATTPVTTADDHTTVEEAYNMLHSVGGDKLPVYREGVFLGMVTMDQIAGWLVSGNARDDQVMKLIAGDHPTILFMKRSQSIMEAVLYFDKHMQKNTVSPVILVTESGNRDEMPIGILSSHDLSRILAALI